MQTRLRLFLKWGITFGAPCILPEKTARAVAYTNKQESEDAMKKRANFEAAYWPDVRTIARDLRLSHATVQRTLRDLEGAGWLVKEQCWRKSKSSSFNIYRIRFCSYLHIHYFL